MSLKRTLAMGQVAGGNHLTADSDEPERKHPFITVIERSETATEYAQRRARENEARAMNLQINGPGARP